MAPLLPVLSVLSPLLLASTPVQEPSAGDETYAPRVQPASREARDGLQRFTLRSGFHLSLFAAEPLLANPVCFAVDAQMRFFVAETFRLHAGVTDMREHMDWLDDELACLTVEDRVAMMQRHEGDAFADKYAVEHERVRRIVDRDGDGLADHSTVFATGFSHPASGIAAGLLPLGNELYYACIPDMWVLRDDDGDGVADHRRSLHTGWGVHIALLGHDMHGLRKGPDGKLYWSIGDRGFHVEHEGQVLHHPRSGAVLRSELDGSDLEIFATGLRNPQELVFDDHGNLFTGDNNSDGGDLARWVYVMEGAESGWRHAFQYVTRPDLRGPWNAEQVWHPPHAGQPAYTVPPVANISAGPSGLTYYPGTGWGPDWRGHFFLCDFRGAPGPSGIHSFHLEQRGAGFELVGAEHFLWGCLATDCDFAADGNLYVLDWVDGWGLTGKGRIYRVEPSGGLFADERAELRRILGAGMVQRTRASLAQFLDHGHRQVRLEAQWELAQRALAATGAALAAEVQPFLERATDSQAPQLSRLHGLWGLGQVIRGRDRSGRVLVPQLLSLARDPDAEVRAQFHKLMGQIRWKSALPVALRGLRDPSLRVRGFAAEALGRFGDRRAFDPLIELLADNDDQDPWLRHAACFALSRLGDPDALAACADHPSAAVRRGAVVALRRLGDPAVARFLHDGDPSIVAEAARAVHDGPIEEAMGSLAELLGRLAPGSAPYLVRRSLCAARHRGGSAQASALARVAASGSGFSARLRVEALEHLARWNAPSPRDPILGEWRPVPARGTGELVSALAALAADGARADWGEPERSAWVSLLRHNPGAASARLLPALVTDLGVSWRVRKAALEALLEDPGRPSARPLEELLAAAVLDPDGRVRARAIGALGQRDPARAAALLASAIAEGTGAERQEAVRALAGLDDGSAASLLVLWLERESVGPQTSPIALELMQVAADSAAPQVRSALESLRRTHVERNPALAPWLFALAGGDERAGRSVFLEKAETSCLRCHSHGSNGASEVGPELTGVGARLSPEEILLAIVDPNAAVAEGYENWMFVLTDETLVVGRIQSEDARTLV
ncbi:MAG: PVC-type heme-binding CxxCH protein, partial [Planctomycetota bacterium]